MKVFFLYTLRSLLKNRSRTLVTVIGIALSMAMVTAVIQGANSGQKFLIQSEINKVGSFYGQFKELTKEEAEETGRDSQIKDSATMSTVGWAEVGEGNEYKPYLLIRSVSDTIQNMVSIKLLEGRMPENDRELLLPAHLKRDNVTDWAVGDSLTLRVGRRMADGHALTCENPYEDGEALTDLALKTYRIVGTYQRLSYQAEPFQSPGYFALTAGAEETYSYTLFFTVKNPGAYYDYIAAKPFQHQTHSDLLRLLGLVSSDSINRLIYGFAGILIILIAFGSVSLIYNSFSMSVSQSTRQFGILKSVGATRRQIRLSVLYEALLLCIVAIPLGMLVGCVGIGITLYALQDAFSSILNVTDTQIKLVLSPVGMGISVLVCLLTTGISAWIPAKRAIKLNPMDAIRQSEDIRIQPKAVKTLPLTRRLFGFEGMLAIKNFKRSRKQYRSTVLSLFVSVTLFISASSFCCYLEDSIGSYSANDIGADITYYVVGEEGEKPEVEKVVSLLNGVDGVTEGTYLDTRMVKLKIGDAETNVILAFLQDCAFDRLCLDNKLDASSFYTSPKALIYNKGVRTIINEKGKQVKSFYSIPIETLPYKAVEYTVKEIDGLIAVPCQEQSGEVYYGYYSPAYITQLKKDNPDGEILPKREKAELILTEEEALIVKEHPICKVIEDTVFPLSSDEPFLIYPYSMEKEVMGEESYQTDFAFKTTDAADSFEKMKTLLVDNNLEESRLFNLAETRLSRRMLITIVNVFSYGFIILISLIASANVFNTLSSNVSLRQREFAMLRSVGMTRKGFVKMLSYECLAYGSKGLLYGLPASLLATYGIYCVTGNALETSFYVPLSAIFVAVGSVFLVVTISMLYATRRLRRSNPMDGLRIETN